jgi:hypothetical protein
MERDDDEIEGDGYRMLKLKSQVDKRLSDS